MKFLDRIPDNVKGIFLIICGFIVLLNTLGLTTHLLKTTVIIGSILLIILGIYMANIHTFIYKLLTKKDSNEQPPQP